MDEMYEELTPKKSRKAKVVDFKPEATDGDGDGYVQDATIWERPIEAEESEPEVTDYIATTGETYLSIAIQFKADKNATEYAKELRQKNKDIAIRTGVLIKL